MAGRTKKIVDNTINDKNKDTIKLEKENKKLKDELEEIKNLLKGLTQNQVPVVNNENVIIEEDEDDCEITPNKYIKVMSLNFGKLVLTTEAKGQGKVYIFNKFGDVRNIMYSDLSNLYHHHSNHGFFY